MSASTTTGGGAGNSPRETVHVIGFGRRLAAAVVDSLIILMITFAFVIAIGILAILVSSFNPDEDLPIRDLIIVVGALTSIFYYVRFWSKSGQTIGMSVLGMRIVDHEGANLTPGKAIVRFVGYIVSAIALSLGFLWIAIDSKRQGWHDKMAGTYVVDVDDFFTPGQATEFVGAQDGNRWVWLVVWFLLVLVAPGVLLAGLFVFGPVLNRVIFQFLQGLFS